MQPPVGNVVVIDHRIMTARALVGYAKRKGWTFVRQGAGSHAIYKHPDRTYVISIPMHGTKDLAKGTLATLIKQIDGTWRPQ